MLPSEEVLDQIMPGIRLHVEGGASLLVRRDETGRQLVAMIPKGYHLARLRWDSQPRTLTLEIILAHQLTGSPPANDPPSVEAGELPYEQELLAHGIPYLLVAKDTIIPLFVLPHHYGTAKVQSKGGDYKSEQVITFVWELPAG